MGALRRSLLQRSLAQESSATGAPLGGGDNAEHAMWLSLVPYLHPCLTAVHAALTEWLSLPARAGGETGEESPLPTIRKIWLAQQALWRHCAETESGGVGGFQRQRFLVLWRSLHKRLATIASPPLQLRCISPHRRVAGEVPPLDSRLRG